MMNRIVTFPKMTLVTGIRRQVDNAVRASGLCLQNVFKEECSGSNLDARTASSKISEV